MLEKGGPSPEMIGILINRGKVGPDRPRGRRPPRPARPCHTVTLDPRPPDGATVHLCCFRHPCLRSCVSTAPGNGCRSPQLSSGFCCVITRPPGSWRPHHTHPQGHRRPRDGRCSWDHRAQQSRAGTSTLAQRLHLGVFLPSPKSSMGKCSW